MGFGVAISGTVITIIIFVFLFMTPGILDRIMDIDDSTNEIALLEESIKDTNVKISSIDATSGSQDVTFSLANFGEEKLWKYDDFYLLVTYDANISGTSTKITEHLDFVIEPPLTIDPITVGEVTTLQADCQSCSFSHEHNVEHASVLIVGLSFDDETVDSVTYAGAPLTQIREDIQGTRHSQLWYLVNPSNGTNTVSISKSDDGDIVAGAITFDGVSDGRPIGSSNGATGTSLSASVSLTTSVDNSIIFDNVETNAVTISADGTQAEQWNLSQGSNVAGASTEQTTSAGPYTMSWTLTGIPDWAISAVEIMPHANKWAISEISNDQIEPGILNPDELATVSGQLTFPIYPGGDISIILSTDRGFTASLSKNVP